MKHNDILSENIKAYRKKNNLKQSEFAKQLGVSRQVLSGYETCKAEPNLAFLIKLSNLMNCSIDSLLGLDENYILKFPFDNPKAINVSPSVSSNSNVYELIKSLKYLIKKNQSTYKELIMSKKRNDRALKELNMSKKRNDRALKELNMSKKRFDIMFNELNRTFNREDRFNKLINKLDSISELISNDNFDLTNSNIETTDLSNNTIEEFANELTPHDDNETYFDEDIDEETVDVMFIDANIAAGEPIPYVNYPEIKKITLKARYPLTKENANSFYILKVKGDSMNKVVEDGEKILVRSTCCVSNGSIAVVNILDESECTLKHYYLYNEKNLIILRPDSYNSSYKDMLFSISDHNIIVQGEYVGNISEFL